MRAANALFFLFKISTLNTTFMKKLILFFSFTILLTSCSSDSSQGQSDQYDRGTMLQNWANNLIVPAIQNYDQKLAALKTATVNFTSEPTTSGLEDLRSAWFEAYKAYQYSAMYNIGKAEELQFTKFCNTYPTNTTLITTKIGNGDVTLEGPGNDVAQGFPALDYLLFGLSDTDVLSFYTENALANNYKSYLTAVVDKLVNLNSAVLNDWNGSFKNTFISKTDNSATGSVNKMVNAYVQYFERDVRTGKVGIPAGRFSTAPLPEKVEGFYSKVYSRELLLNGLQASWDFFNGKHFNATTKGPSLAYYLDFLKTQGYGSDAETPLSEVMDNQYSQAYTAIMDMQENLYQQVLTDNNKMLTAYDKMQRNVTYMKTDMMSAMSISVDYVDTDGD